MSNFQRSDPMLPGGRANRQNWSETEWAISFAMHFVEEAGASVALTDAVILLAQAKARVADHYEDVNRDHTSLNQGTSPASEVLAQNQAYREALEHLRRVVEAARVLNGDYEEQDGIQRRWDHYCSDGVGYCKAVSVSALEALDDALAALASTDSKEVG